MSKEDGDEDEVDGYNHTYVPSNGHLQTLGPVYVFARSTFKGIGYVIMMVRISGKGGVD